MREEIKHIYGTLQGCLVESPKDGYNRTPNLWEFYHSQINDLNAITGKDYSKFKVSVDTQYGEAMIDISEYRSKLHGLIGRLHREYFSDESDPFGGSPGIVVTQQVQQTVQLTIALEVQALIDKQLYTGSLEPAEKTFLEKVKQLLPTIKSIAELLSVIITTAKSSGISIDQLSKLLGF